MDIKLRDLHSSFCIIINKTFCCSSTLVGGGSYSRVSNYTLPEYDKALARCNVYSKFWRITSKTSFDGKLWKLYPTWISYIVLLIMYQWARPPLFLGSVCLFLKDHMHTEQKKWWIRFSLCEKNLALHCESSLVDVSKWSQHLKPASRLEICVIWFEEV